jgi:hypothetical protein
MFLTTSYAVSNLETSEQKKQQRVDIPNGTNMPHFKRPSVENISS